VQCVCVVCDVGVMAVEIQEPQVTIGLDLREMTFQNVVDNILRPSGIKIGGFPEELFLNLTEQEHQDVMCNIWYVISSWKYLQMSLIALSPFRLFCRRPLKRHFLIMVIICISGT